MRYLVSIITVLIILSCLGRDTVPSDKDKAKYEGLQQVLYSSPETVLDSLSEEYSLLSEIYKGSLKNELQERSEALTALMYTIAYELKYGAIKSDTLLIHAHNWFIRHEENYNVCRSSLYRAMYNINISKVDSTAYELLKKAEQIYTSEAINEKELGATLYLYLGIINKARANSTEAIAYLYHSYELSVESSYKIGILNAGIELFNYYVGTKEYGKALAAIASFGDETSLPPYLEYNYYNAMYIFNMAKKDNIIATEYLKKILNIETNEEIELNYPKIYYQLANIYKRMDEPDSTLKYSILSVQSIKDNTIPNSHFYYRHLGDIYSNRGDHKTAAIYYRNALQSHIDAYTLQAQSRALDPGNKYDLEIKKSEISELKREINLYIVLILLLALSITIIWFTLSIRLKESRKKTNKLNESLYKNEQELNKLWLTSELYKSSSPILPQFINSVYTEAVRSRKVSNEIFDSLNSIIDQANIQSRSTLSSIIDNPDFNNIFGHIENLNLLTDFEKLVYIFNEHGFSNQEIANFLNSSQSSIRTVKGKILRKIKNLPNENCSEQ